MQTTIVTTLSAAELAQWQAAHKPFVLLDVRRSQAVAASGFHRRTDFSWLGLRRG